MPHWLDAFFGHLPHFGYALVFLVVFLNNLGLPLPGETVLFGAGFVSSRSADSLWEPMLAGTLACFFGGICAFLLGRRLGDSSLETIQWLHLTPARLDWPKRQLDRHGAKTILVGRFIALLPPAIVNVLAGMTDIRWRTFLSFNITGSAAYAVFYILIGYFLGNQWRIYAAWLGPEALYGIVAAMVLIVLAILFRRVLYRCIALIACTFRR